MVVDEAAKRAHKEPKNAAGRDRGNCEPADQLIRDTDYLRWPQVRQSDVVARGTLPHRFKGASFAYFNSFIWGARNITTGEISRWRGRSCTREIDAVPDQRIGSRFHPHAAP